MELIAIIEGIIGLIILICFFVLCTNVAAIKDHLREQTKSTKKAFRTTQNANYYLHRALGNNQEALNYLSFLLMYDLTEGVYGPVEAKAKYEDFKKKHEAKYTELGIAFPEYPF